MIVRAETGTMNRQQVEDLVRYYIETSNCPDMRAYGKGFLDHFEGGLCFVQQMMQLGGMYNARVLDLGCGFGWHALLISLLGGSDVVANDVRPLMIRNVDDRLRTLETKFDCPIRVQTLCGDFTEIDLAPESFDTVFCNQTIEHLHDLDGSFRKVKTLLRPGGTLVVANDNNRLRRGRLKEMEEMWNNRDLSWEFVRKLQQERPEENKDIKPYAIMREKIIHDARRELPDSAAQSLVHATAGQTASEILASVETYLADGSLPTRPEYSWCRNPVTGEYCERQFDPFELKDDLKRHGFRVRLLQDIRRRGLLGVLGRIDLGWLHRVVFTYRSAFVLVARKP